MILQSQALSKMEKLLIDKDYERHTTYMYVSLTDRLNRA